MGAVHDLEERPITFDYAYKMSCPDCPGITTLTSAEYYSEPNSRPCPEGDAVAA